MLSFSNLLVASLQGMPALPALATLNFSFTPNLASLQGIPALPALATLDLSGSNVASLQGMPTGTP
jgi:Leucine-rich repeat (LRR) protein